jgi:hypothetical protein
MFMYVDMHINTYAYIYVTHMYVCVCVYRPVP